MAACSAAHLKHSLSKLAQHAVLRLPLWGGCLQLYTQEFYETVVKAKLNPGGIFVTQSGPAGVMSASQVRCCAPCWALY